MSDRQSRPALSAPPAGTPAQPHPMDPRRGPGLSPMFAAFLCWLLDLPPVTEPAIVGVAVTGGCVFVATSEDPTFNGLLGSWQDCQDNLRGWGAACDATPEAVDALIARARLGPA